jgi:hypothetical protein
MTKKEIFIYKKFYHPVKGGEEVERSSRRMIVCAIAALGNNASNWGGKGGCLGFFEYSFSLVQWHLLHVNLLEQWD